MTPAEQESNNRPIPRVYLILSDLRLRFFDAGQDDDSPDVETVEACLEILWDQLDDAGIASVRRELSRINAERKAKETP